MSRRVGVVLGADRALAALAGRRGGAPRAVAEAPFDPARPGEAVASLRAALGEVDAIALAVGLAHLTPRAVRLPPAPAAARVRALALEPDRFFAVAPGEPVGVALAADGALAFAMPAGPLEAWVAAFAQWAPVGGVEPAPVPLARALAARGAADGCVVLPAGPGEQGLVDVAGGRVLGVRRTPAADDAGAAAAPASDAEPELLAALGAAEAADVPLPEQLLTGGLARRAAARARRRLLAWGAAAAAACAFAVWALDRRQTRTLAALDVALARAASEARPALTLAERARVLDRELAAGGASGAAGDSVVGDAALVLGALGARLPAGAVVQRVRAAGAEWQVDGSARDAAAVLAALASEPVFRDVRVLAPSASFVEAGGARESFSVAFRAGGAGAR